MALPNKNYRVDVFETDHVVPSQGYVINSTKRKLKPEYLVRRLPPHTYPTCNAEIVRRSRVHTRRLKCSAKDALKFGISDGGVQHRTHCPAHHPPRVRELLRTRRDAQFENRTCSRRIHHSPCVQCYRQWDGRSRLLSRGKPWGKVRAPLPESPALLPF
jgi:hypothetical protein